MKISTNQQDDGGDDGGDGGLPKESQHHHYAPNAGSYSETGSGWPPLPPGRRSH